MKNRLIGAAIAIAIMLGILSSLFTVSVAAEVIDYGETTITEADVKYVYDRLCAEITKTVPSETIHFSNLKSISKAEMEKAVALFIGDHPECFWFRNYYSYQPVGSKVTSISPKYSFVGEELVVARAELENAVEGIMAGLPEGSSYDKALYLHDVLAKRVEYVLEGEHQTAYGALVAGEAVCAGYAAAYQLLLERAGITAWTVTGQSKGVDHAWNVVWLDALTCVYTDVTWDDQGDEIYHYYFNLSKSEMEADHTVDAERFTLPECDHTDESYFDLNRMEEQLGIVE